MTISSVSCGMGPQSGGKVRPATVPVSSGQAKDADGDSDGDTGGAEGGLDVKG